MRELAALPLQSVLESGLACVIYSSICGYLHLPIWVVRIQVAVCDSTCGPAQTLDIRPCKKSRARFVRPRVAQRNGRTAKQLPKKAGRAGFSKQLADQTATASPTSAKHSARPHSSTGMQQNRDRDDLGTHAWGSGYVDLGSLLSSRSSTVVVELGNILEGNGRRRID